MKRTVWVSLLALMISVCVASVSTAKGNHAMTMTGTVSSVDKSAMTFSLETKDGKQTPISWTSATKVHGGALKDGEHVDVSVLPKDGKNVATSIRISPAKVAKAS